MGRTVTDRGEVTPEMPQCKFPGCAAVFDAATAGQMTSAENSTLPPGTGMVMFTGWRWPPQACEPDDLMPHDHTVS